MHQLRTNRALDLSANMLDKTKKRKRSRKAYDICSIFYFMTSKNSTTLIEQSIKMRMSIEFVSKMFRIQVQISQQQQNINSKKKTQECIE